jgi:hypothetical protein
MAKSEASEPRRSGASGGRRRLRDKSFLAPLWRDVGIVSLLLLGAYTLISQKEKVNLLEKRVEDLAEAKDLLSLQKKVESLAEAKDVLALKKWAGCLDEKEETGQPYKFYWPTLECALAPAPPTKVQTGGGKTP